MKQLVFLIALIATPLHAQQVTDRSGFVALIEGKTLSRLGVTLTVGTDGSISGRAFGSKVGGSWSWSGPFFCRDLIFGGESLGYDCQTVKRAGNKLTFTAKKGQGDSATLTIN